MCHQRIFDLLLGGGRAHACRAAPAVAAAADDPPTQIVAVSCHRSASSDQPFTSTVVVQTAPAPRRSALSPEPAVTAIADSAGGGEGPARRRRTENAAADPTAPASDRQESRIDQRRSADRSVRPAASGSSIDLQQHPRCLAAHLFKGLADRGQGGWTLAAVGMSSKPITETSSGDAQTARRGRRPSRRRRRRRSRRRWRSAGRSAPAAPGRTR